VEGNSQSALNDLGSIVLTQKIAAALFGKENAMGRSVEIKSENTWKAYTVSGIAKDVPENSSLGFSALTRFENFYYYAEAKDQWSNNTHEAFLQLRAQANPAAFEAKAKSFVHKYYADRIKQLKIDGGKPDSEGELFRIRLIPFADVHFNSISNLAGASRSYPWLLLLISGFILFIASVNFVNLSLGRAFTRSREIGMRKVLGASRGQLLGQFWGEAMIICCISLLLGALAAAWCLPAYKKIFNQSLASDILTSPAFIFYSLLAFAAVSLLGGGYPAWIMSAVNTAQSVKGKSISGKSNRLRNSLMLVQFVVSALLILCTTVVWQQLTYMRTKPLGYNKEQVISIPIGSAIDAERSLQLVRNSLAPLPEVLSVTGTDINLGRGRDGGASTSVFGFEYKGKTVKTNWLRVDFDYLKTLDIPLVAGRDFSRDFGPDTAVVVINEKMAAALGEKNPLDAVLDVDGSHLRVAGVVKDYNFKSLHQEIKPLTMMVRKNWPMSYLFIKVKPGNTAASMAAVQKVWKQINPKAESEPSFLDENVDKQYRKEARLTQIFTSGAVLTIIISCMGLFAMAVLAMTQRTKEIGVRKVLGASVGSIVTLLSKEFLLLVVVSLLVASPIAWYAMNKWLAGFAYHISISWWMFLFTGLLVMFITLATLSFQAIKSALANPVNSLKRE
ncbi:MAG TPA: FtsX-like permease family protein, partial [Chitinophagaceae bacterium]|nr:FtsX-like permease family protein [Chitinophagaceae bacterium]